MVKWRVKREVEFVKRFWRVSDIVCNCIKCVATGYKFVGVFFLRNESTWLGFWGAALISKHTHTPHTQRERERGFGDGFDSLRICARGSICSAQLCCTFSAKIKLNGSLPEKKVTWQNGLIDGPRNWDPHGPFSNLQKGLHLHHNVSGPLDLGPTHFPQIIGEEMGQ